MERIEFRPIWTDYCTACFGNGGEIDESEFDAQISWVSCPDCAGTGKADNQITPLLSDADRITLLASAPSRVASAAIGLRSNRHGSVNFWLLLLARRSGAAYLDVALHWHWSRLSMAFTRRPQATAINLSGGG